MLDQANELVNIYTRIIFCDADDALNYTQLLASMVLVINHTTSLRMWLQLSI